MSWSVQRPPIQGRGYSVRGLMSVGGGSGPVPKRPPCPEPAEGPPSLPPSPARPPPSPPARPEPAAGPPAAGVGAPERPGVARCCSIGAATRALATSVSRPTWLCHQPLHAIAPSQKFVYIEL